MPATVRDRPTQTTCMSGSTPPLSRRAWENSEFQSSTSSVTEICPSSPASHARAWGGSAGRATIRNDWWSLLNAERTLPWMLREFRSSGGVGAGTNGGMAPGATGGPEGRAPEVPAWRAVRPGE